MYTYTHIYIDMYTHTHICIHLFIHTRINIHMYICSEDWITVKEAKAAKFEDGEAGKVCFILVQI